MARYRKIDLRIHADSKYRSLSAPQPNGQTLWMYLLTSPHGMSIPGLLSVGETGLAEALGWPLKAFREVFAEVAMKHMCEADWKARVVWVPNALKYNPPESPNAVKSWRKFWDEVPECDLKRKSVQALEKCIANFGEGYEKAFKDAFSEALRDGLSEALREPCPYQEQEQEQEQKQKEKRSRPRWSGDGAALPGMVLFWNSLPKKSRDRSSQKQVQKQWVKQDLEEQATTIISALEKWKLSYDWTKDDGQFIPGAHRWLENEKWKELPSDIRTPQAQKRDLSTVDELWESTADEGAAFDAEVMGSKTSEVKP